MPSALKLVDEVALNRPQPLGPYLRQLYTRTSVASAIPDVEGVIMASRTAESEGWDTSAALTMKAVPGSMLAQQIEDIFGSSDVSGGALSWWNARKATSILGCSGAQKHYRRQEMRDDR
jgi:hypothetical protein